MHCVGLVAWQTGLLWAAALPALGGAAGLKPATALCLTRSAGRMGLLRSPTRGEPARHN